MLGFVSITAAVLVVKPNKSENLRNIRKSKMANSFYRNDVLKQHVKDSIETFFTDKNPSLKWSEIYSLNIQIEKSQTVLCLSETNCDQSQEGFPEEEPPVYITNDVPSPVPTLGSQIESATQTICDQEASTIIMHYQSVVFFTLLMSVENAHFGFGDPSRNFWIGFDTLNTIMDDQSHVLDIEHTLDDGSKHHATYDDFRLGYDGRGIKSLGEYTGSLSDGLREFENKSPKNPLWILSVCDMQLPIKSAVMRIRKRPG